MGHDSQPLRIAPKFKARAPVPESLERETSRNPPEPPPPPIWTPKSAPSSPLPEKREFKSVNFESPILSRKTPQRPQEAVQPPWSQPGYDKPPAKSAAFDRPLATSFSTPALNTNGTTFTNHSTLNNKFNVNLPKSQSPTVTLLQRAREGQIARSASYTDTEKLKSSRTINTTASKPNEIVYRKEYVSEPETESEQITKKMTTITPKKYDGIGPTTRGGLPLTLRSEVDEVNQAKWYKKMYNTIHKTKDDDDYVTVRYKTRRGRYPYKSANGYMSEPEPNYDSDFSLKYNTLDRRRTPSASSQYEHNRSKFGTMESPVQPNTISYRNQPRRIENYTTGHSSISEKESKQWWDEVMDIFDGHLEQQKLAHNPSSYSQGNLSRALKEQGYESDSTLVFRKKEESSQMAPLSPVEQKQYYRTMQAGGEPPLQGFRKPAPEKPKDDVDIEYLPISSTLTKMRIQKKNLEAIIPKEIVCYPITSISRPLDMFGAFPKEIKSFVPIVPPPPPNRKSSKTNTTLKIFSSSSSQSAAANVSKSSSIGLEKRDSSKNLATYSVKKVNKIEQYRSKSAGPSFYDSSLTMSSLKEEKNSENSTRTANRSLYRASSSSPVCRHSHVARYHQESRKSSPSPVAFGRGISKERTFAEEKKKLEQNLIRSCKELTLSTSILRNPELKSPNEVKKALRNSIKPLPYLQDKNLKFKTAKKNSSVSNLRSSTTLYASNRSISNQSETKQGEKSLKVSVAFTSSGRQMQRSTTELNRGKETKVQRMVKSLTASSTSLPARQVAQRTKTTKTVLSNSNVSLARTNSTYSIDSTNSKKKPSGRKSKLSASKERIVPITISSQSAKKAPPKEKAKVKKKEPSKPKASSTKSGRKDYALVESINEAIVQQNAAIRSDSFFQNLFLRDQPPLRRPLCRNTSVLEKARHWNSLNCKSEPSLRLPNYYLTQSRPVSSSKFKVMESDDFAYQNMIADAKARYNGNVMEQITRFDSYYQLSDEEEEFGLMSRGRSMEFNYSYQERSKSEPPPKTLISEIIKPNTPVVIHGRNAIENAYRREIQQRTSRSPSCRKIQNIKSNRSSSEVSETIKRIERARSLNSADRKSGTFQATDLYRSNSLSIINYEKHTPICYHRQSERFRDLNDFYSSLERIGHLEQVTSSSDLRPIRKDEDIIDFDLWKKIRAQERAERELRALVHKLKGDQKEKDLLYLPHDVDEIRWNCYQDSGLRNKEKSVEDIKEELNRHSYFTNLENTKIRDIEAQKDTYKPLWRGSSVLDTASNMSVKYNTIDVIPKRKSALAKSTASVTETESKFGLSSKLLSTLSNDQMKKLKTQLSEIYNNNSSGSVSGDQKLIKLEDYSDKFVINVPEKSSDNQTFLKVRSNSLLSKQQLLEPILKKQEQTQKKLWASSSNGNLRSIETTKQVSEEKTTFSETDKKKLSQFLCREIKDKITHKRQSSLESERQTKSSSGATIEEYVPKRESKTSLDKVRPASVCETESISSETSNKTVIFRAAAQVPVVEDIKNKIKYFEERAQDELAGTTIYHAREDSSPDEEEIVKAIEHKIKTRSAVEAVSKPIPKSPTLSSAQSFTDLRELFGEKQSMRNYNYSELSYDNHKESITIEDPKASPAATPTLNNYFTSYEVIERSRSVTPEVTPKHGGGSYLNTIKFGDVRKIKDKFESLDCSLWRKEADESLSPRRFQSDPDLNKSSIAVSLSSAAASMSAHKLCHTKVKSHEVGDVSRITHKYELRNSVASRARSRTRKVISPIPKHTIKKDDRFMPHINVISKTASLKREIRKYPSLSSPITESDKGDVDKIKSKFESQENLSLLGKMYTSAPDFRELKDISSYLSGSWVAHKFPKPQDNARSLKCPGRTPENTSVVRRNTSSTHSNSHLRSNSTSPPRCKDTAILKQFYDIFADQHFDPLKHRPKYRYIPERQFDADYLWKKMEDGVAEASGAAASASDAIDVAGGELMSCLPGASTASATVASSSFATAIANNSISSNAIATSSSKKNSVKFQEFTVVPPPPPIKGSSLHSSSLNSESPRRYVEGDVNIHYKTPIRYEFKHMIPEDELAYIQAEHMKKVYEEERRRKYMQEVQDMNNRRHTDNFIQSQKSPISLNRYDDFNADLSLKVQNVPKTIAKGLYNFQGQSARELSFRKGDIIYIRRQVDTNWYEGEHNAMVGLIPANYVELIMKDGVRLQPSIKKPPSEGQARAKYNFSAQTSVELSLNKGELVALTRRVDDNWFEGRIGSRKGIFPVSYVEVLTDIGSNEDVLTKPLPPPSHSLVSYHNESIVNDQNVPQNGLVRETKTTRKTEVLHVDTDTNEPIAYRAMYTYRPQNTDELELQEGDTVYVLEKCDDGWYVGTSQRTGYFGTFPGNYVKKQ